MSEYDDVSVAAYIGIRIVALTICILIAIIPQLIYIAISPLVVCYVNDELVYQGRSACLDIETAGAATKVSVKGFLCVLPKAKYVSNNVRVNN